MVIDGDKYDFMANDNDRSIVLEQIVNKLKEVGKLPENWDKSTNISLEA